MNWVILTKVIPATEKVENKVFVMVLPPLKIHMTWVHYEVNLYTLACRDHGMSSITCFFSLFDSLAYKMLKIKLHNKVHIVMPLTAGLNC
jgi:hypothetical protein